MPESSSLRDMLSEKSGQDTGVLDSDFDGSAVSELRKSPTALEVDRWSLRRGRDAVDDWKALGTQGELDPLLAADAMTSLFEPEPKLADRPEDECRSEWFKQLMETPEYKSLHNQTMYDPLFSCFGAKNIYEQWVEYVKKLPPGSKPGDGIGDEMARIRSTAKACEEAKKEVEDVKDMIGGLGMGSGGSPIDPEEVGKWFKKVRKHDLLRNIMAWAGSGRRLCKSIQRRKVHSIRGEMTGIELGGDIARLLPYEKAQIAGVVPELEIMALYRLATKRSLVYKMKKNEPKISGPIVIVVDESGSMTDKICAAKGLALTMAWLAQEQNRWVALIGYEGKDHGNDYKHGVHHMAVFPPNKRDQNKLVEWLEHFFGSGGNLDLPVWELPKNYWPELVKMGLQKGKTDVIMITDAALTCTDKIKQNYLDWAKAEQVKTYGITIGHNDGDGNEDFKAICTRHFAIPKLDLDSSPLEEIFAIG